MCSGLLYHSKSELVPARVTSISFKDRPSKTGTVFGFLLQSLIWYRTGLFPLAAGFSHLSNISSFLGTTTSFYEVNYVGESGSAHSLYDIVVIATPLHRGSDITFSGFSPPIPSHYPGRYHQTVSTLVHGLLNTSYLGSAKPASEFTVSEILTTDSKDSVINSLSSLDPVHVPPGYKRPPASQSNVWKVFSPQPLSQEQLRSMFLSWDSVSETPWLAYPSYRPPQRNTPPFILHERLYYLNAVEWAASAMEMSAISARNVALLAHHRWHRQVGNVDQEDLHTRLRSEL